MKILIVGSGGREHALAWKLQQSPQTEKLYCAPGNGGTAGLADNVPIAVDDIPALVAFAKEQHIGLAVVGPELPLTLGLVDALTEAGIPAFGPTREAARLEGSKAFSKDFMARHGIPTAKYGIFSAVEPAKAFVRTFESACVVKADGLAAGKGVLICETQQEADAAIDYILAENAFGAAGASLVIEEYLEGEELSLMAFSDGKTVVPMMTAQDHKRIFDGDQGPNTGGMGAYAPAPVGTAELVTEVQKTVLQPVVDAMAAEGREFKGVLYAGLMITAKGPMVLEFNARFGDPETEVVLPMLKTDLVSTIMACIDGTLDRLPLEWQSGHCVTVVLAAHGYPGTVRKGDVIRGLDQAPEDVIVFHCGTAQKQTESGSVFQTSGGRVLSVTALGDTLPLALKKAYAGVKAISFDGMQYRSDIAHRALNRS